MLDDNKLTVKQNLFVQAMLACRTIDEAARAAGIASRTADRWLTKPAVRLALAETQARTLAQVTRRLVTAMSGALDTLRDIHSNPAANIGARVSAARAILDAGLKYSELVDLQERLAKVELALEEVQNEQRASQD